MRCFIALELPDGLLGETVALSRTLARTLGGRFVAYENLHVTLAFLGEIGEAQAAAAISALDGVCGGRAPVMLAPEGLGSFGKPSNATLWLGLAKTPELTGLVKDLEAALDDRGLSYDRRSFVPHVTLARHVRLGTGALDALPFPAPQEAGRVTLFKSILGPEGATYKPLHTVTLSREP